MAACSSPPARRCGSTFPTRGRKWRCTCATNGRCSGTPDAAPARFATRREGSGPVRRNVPFDKGRKCQKGRSVAQSQEQFTLKALAQASADESYTRKLLDRGIAHCAKKLGEEAIETAIAAIAEDRERVIAETADLLYHLLVVLEARGITLAEVETALTERTAKTGLEEKASRPRD